MEKVMVCFDKVGNTLDIWIDDPSKESINEETQEELVLKKDKDGRVIGIEILNFMPQPEERIEVVRKFIPIKLVAQAT